MDIRYVDDNDDLLLISDIYEQSWRMTYKGMLPSRYLKKLPVGNWKYRINRFGSRSMVMVSGGEYIGTVSFGKSSIEKYSEWGEVYSIYLLPRYTGMGLGKRLMDSALLELKKQGYSKVLLFALEKNLAARKFYENYGFTASGDMMKKKFGHKMVTEVMYAIELEQDIRMPDL